MKCSKCNWHGSRMVGDVNLKDEFQCPNCKSTMIEYDKSRNFEKSTFPDCKQLPVALSDDSRKRLAELDDLRQNGLLSQEEFLIEKHKLVLEINIAKDTRRKAILSRLFFLVGVFYIYQARVAYDTSPLHTFFYYISISLYAFIFAYHPQVLFEPINLMNLFAINASRSKIIVTISIIANTSIFLALGIWVVSWIVDNNL